MRHVSLGKPPKAGCFRSTRRTPYRPAPLSSRAPTNVSETGGGGACFRPGRPACGRFALGRCRHASRYACRPPSSSDRNATPDRMAVMRQPRRVGARPGSRCSIRWSQPIGRPCSSRIDDASRPCGGRRCKAARPEPGDTIRQRRAAPRRPRDHAMPIRFAVAAIACAALSTISSTSCRLTTSGGDSSMRSPVARMIRLPLKQ